MRVRCARRANLGALRRGWFGSTGARDMANRFARVVLWGALLLAGCESDPRRGAAGESCTRRDDCGDGLHCLGQVCVAADAGAPSSPAGAGALGDSCGARRDCAAGLACIANECAPASNGMQASSRYSGRGESCAASNECASELACVAGTCVAVTVALPRTTKSCERIECMADADCCADFVPNPNCEAYRQNCETDPVFCNTYRSLCQCSRRCTEELCAVAAPGCTLSAECTSLQTPFCVAGSCVQCETDANCPGQDAKCSEGVCMSACMSDEQCPLLHACQDGSCAEVGCRSDRECVFMNRDPDARCRDTECRTPCDSDSDCAADDQQFHVCVEGACVFVGCETDAECRALLHLENQPSTKIKAVCR
jgi:hypothetical protein